MIFILPHIFAGHFLFFDKHYFNHYKKILLLPGLALPLAAYPLFFIFLKAIYFLLLFDVWTIWHTWSQQAGITKVSIRKYLQSVRAWSMFGFVLIIPIYLQTYGSTKFFAFKADFLTGLWWLGGLYFLISLIFLTRNIWENALVLSTSSIPFLSYTYNHFGYPALAIFGFCFVYDISAFYIYSVHDVNRNSSDHLNLVHKTAGFFKIPAWVSLVFISILSTAFFSLFKNEVFIINYFVISISIFNYFSESIVWNNNQMYRNFMTYG